MAPTSPETNPAAVPRPVPLTTRDRLFHVSDDILGLRLPMPPPLEWVNVYFLRDGDGWALVDTGYNTPDSRAVLIEALDEYLDEKPITRVIVTHYHPDHIGQAGYICERYKCPLYMTQTEWLLGRWLSTDATPTYMRTIADYYERAQVPVEMYTTLTERGNSFLRTSDEVPPSFHHIVKNDVLTIGKQKWQVLIGKGHAPEMITLYDAENKMLISADHIVARITPNISIWAYDTDTNPLKDYLDSIQWFVDHLPDDIQVLPGHGRTFENFHERIAGYKTHHQGRLDKLLNGFDGEPKNLYQLLKVLFPRDLSPRDFVFAMGETHSHINYLVEDGRVKKLSDRPFLFQKA